MKKTFSCICVAVIMFFITTQIQQTNHKNYNETVKIGIIDSVISDENLKYYNLKLTKRYINQNIENLINHGDVILNIIKKNTVNVELYYAQVLNCNNNGQVTYVVDAINWCIENNVDIINMSFATSNNNILFKNTILKAINSNIIIVASCMNDYDGYSYPAMYKGVISVSNDYHGHANIIIPKKEYTLDLPVIGCKRFIGTSYDTAYVTSKISKLLVDNKFDKLKTITDLKTKYK